YKTKQTAVPVEPAAGSEVAAREIPAASVVPEPAVTASVSSQKYTVGKNDTLQKISKKFYGTTKKWTKIYEANKDVLSGPDKVYPGQELNIPQELAEPKENLK
ncbi:MAG: LysM peptidoglycan-binding domain-containing protein, partial [Candidatus Omnitrophica bacterium]|nr:LysM peptidoglycan-binding domain-containing protein [Candidatus Omnitrophota bacterium]